MPIETVQDFELRAAVLDQKEQLLGIRQKKYQKLLADHGSGPINIEVSGWGFREEGTIFGNLYVDYAIKVSTALGTEWVLHKRYREIKELYENIKKRSKRHTLGLHVNSSQQDTVSSVEVSDTGLRNCPLMPPKRVFTARDDRRLLQQRAVAFTELLKYVVQFEMGQFTRDFIELSENGIVVQHGGDIMECEDLKEAYQQSMARTVIFSEEVDYRNLTHSLTQSLTESLTLAPTLISL